MNESHLSAIAADLNDVPLTAARTGRYTALVKETNQAVRQTALTLLTLDANPHSFAAFKAATPPAQGGAA